MKPHGSKLLTVTDSPVSASVSAQLSQGVIPPWLSVPRVGATSRDE